MSQFDPKKDYYAVLGVMPDAEDVVITAAYRALVSRYHPDRWSGDPSIAHTRTAEINEAYGVLGDGKLKSEYDKFRGDFSILDETTTQQAEVDEALQYMEDRWEVATTIYPDLVEIRKRLSRTARRLAFYYVVVILETKKFKERHEIAKAMEDGFLKLHFGQNPEILKFAKQLIKFGIKDAVKSLNKLVDVLGDDADPNKIISQIKEKFNTDKIIAQTFGSNRKLADDERISEMKAMVRAQQREVDAINLARNLGYRYLTSEGKLFSKSNVKLIEVESNEIVFEGRSSKEATQWIIKNLANE